MVKKFYTQKLDSNGAFTNLEPCFQVNMDIFGKILYKTSVSNHLKIFVRYLLNTWSMMPEAIKHLKEFKCLIYVMILEQGQTQRCQKM